MILLGMMIYFRHTSANQQVVFGLFAAAVVAYLLVGPIVFIAPLLPFRDAMLRNKADLMNGIARRIRIELDRLKAKLPKGSISKEDEELIERLRKIGAVVDEMPVWPFDAVTLRKFFSAYIVPIAGGGIVTAAKSLIGKFALFS